MENTTISTRYAQPDTDARDSAPMAVAELSRRVRHLLEREIGVVRVTGEISNLARPRSGHWYFTLKDSQAQIRAAMFANRNRSVRFDVTEGVEVIVRGRVSLYEPRGDFQLIVESLQPAGEGALRAAYEALKRALEEEGLFSEANKRELPAFPARIALITSATGAARRDIESVLARRFPAVSVLLLPVLVQGDGAEATVLEALERVPALACDVVILARGGGSIEDLWTFNLESVARAIRACPVPVVSAVGHETDFTIADFAADMRAPTPSAAAELVVPNAADLLSWVQDRGDRMARLIKARLNNYQQQLSLTAKRLRHPRRALEMQMQRLDDAERRLLRAARALGPDAKNNVTQLSRRLLRASPRLSLDNRQRALDQANQRLQRANHLLTEKRDGRVDAARRALVNLSPNATLSRGYSIITTPADDRIGEPVVSADQLLEGDLVAHFADGSRRLHASDIQPSSPTIKQTTQGLLDETT
ncbi:MAG: exodeoxyribonuclease VII large subunit [Pseudomonadaceae bacterium]|nr:exodeoxyribonuclease VII large subunit [Pseudomonadaceae bacterium]